MTARRQDLRNIAIIAHVDHGKTTLVDALLKQAGSFRSHEAVADRVMDRLDQERERGITIMAKNTGVILDGVRINIVDTPGHADFGGEVERTLHMVDGVLLLVDAAEGPLPQTRFVLQKALALHSVPIVCINKVDRQDARPAEVLNAVYGCSSTWAPTKQLEFPVLYAVARDGWAVRGDAMGPGLTWRNCPSLHSKKARSRSSPCSTPSSNTSPLPSIVAKSLCKSSSNALDYDEYVGRLAIGRIHGGRLTKRKDILAWHENGTKTTGKAVALYLFDGPQTR